MAPFGMPWSTFSAFLVLGGTILLALVWAAWDRVRDPDASDDREDER